MNQLESVETEEADDDKLVSDEVADRQSAASFDQLVKELASFDKKRSDNKRRSR